MKAIPHQSRIQSEIVHGRKLAEKAEEIWHWEGAIGRARYERRSDYLSQHLREGVRCLEIGCGTGLYSARFAATGAALVAIDVSHDLIRKARKRVPSVHLAVADACRTCFPGETFDVIIGSSILHHVDVPLCLQELHRILKKGGTLCFTEPNYLNPHVFLERKVPFLRKWLGVSDYETAFLRWDLEKKLREAGFAAVSVKPFDFLYPMFPASWLRFLKRLGELFEKTPLLREIAGSIQIMATR